ncbi:hypothetical protein SynMINOS11_00608 [Synechococcus sp. Minos11]|nr:hypothetical protein SynMINOS11_00608 [Synechococcus sp. Minos11]
MIFALIDELVKSRHRTRAEDQSKSLVNAMMLLYEFIITFIAAVVLNSC